MFKLTNSVRAKKSAKVQIPVLMLQSAVDHYVVSPAENLVCGRWAHCQLLLIPNTLHEILMEKDEARNQAFAAIKAFIQ
jgi:alpha-beta hydrolase superfamily lysophospholipase